MKIKGNVIKCMKFNNNSVFIYYLVYHKGQDKNGMNSQKGKGNQDIEENNIGGRNKRLHDDLKYSKHNIISLRINMRSNQIKYFNTCLCCVCWLQLLLLQLFPSSSSSIK